MFSSDPEEVYDSNKEKDEEENEDEPCDKSQASADDFAVLTECTEEVEVDRLLQAHKVEEETETLGQTCIILKRGLNMDIKIPEEPPEAPVPKVDQGEIEFEKVDNPGDGATTSFGQSSPKKEVSIPCTTFGCAACAYGCCWQVVKEQDPHSVEIERIEQLISFLE